MGKEYSVPLSDEGAEALGQGGGVESVPKTRGDDQDAEERDATTAAERRTRQELARGRLVEMRAALGELQDAGEEPALV